MLYLSTARRRGRGLNLIFEEYKISISKKPGPRAWFFLSIFGVKDDGYWAIIDQFYLHICSKDSCLNRNFLG